MTEPARHFQHYEVLRREDGSLWELGRGAMGITYKAYDVNLCCEVALKVVNSALLDHPDARERFVREARAAALRHRHVASVYHLGNDGEHFFYAMEFIDGETLDALVRRRGPLPTRTVLKIILQVAKALVAADRQRLVHRDLKPTNLMIVHEDADEDLTIKVIDFGLARSAAGGESVAAVTMGGFVGTPQYASPEQLEESPLDARSDLYSLGITTWYLLTARPPFSGSLASVCQQQLSKPPPWEQLPADLPESVRRLLGHLLEKSPANRPQSARELRAEIEACLDGLPPDTGEAFIFGPGGAGSGEPFSAPSLRHPEPAGHPATLGNGRYTVRSQRGEEPGVEIFRARDEEQGGSPVTLRVLASEWLGSPDEQARFAEEVRHVQAAAHPNLVQLYALELAHGASPTLLTEEPLVSFTLAELLAARGGRLSTAETLALLGPVAAAADHAESCRLQSIDLSLRQIRVHFPFADLDATTDAAAREMLPLAFSNWPAWHLKVHPLTMVRNCLEPGTWAGDVTLVPAVRSPVAGRTPAGSVPALARLGYELLGGTSSTRVITLPSLSEAANAILTKALTDPLAYPTGGAFLATFAEAVNSRGELGAVSLPPKTGLGPASASSQRIPGAVPRVGTSALVTAAPTGPVATAAPTRARATFRQPPLEGVVAETSAPASVAGFFEDDGRTPATFPVAEDIGNSAWERLSLTDDARGPKPGRWLLGLTAALVVFVGAFAAVFVTLLHGGFGNGPKSAISSRPLAQVSTTPPAAQRPPVQDVPTPAASPSATAIRFNDAVLPTVTAAASAPPPPSEPPTVSTGPSPATVDSPGDAEPPSTSAGKLVTVHVDSTPTGASVWWQDKLAGITPLDIQLPPGDQDLIARKKGSLDTHQFVHVEADRSPSPEMIRLMDPSLVPSFRPPPRPRDKPALRATPFTERDPRNVRVRVRPGVPVAPTTPFDQTPVLRPLPLEPFEQNPGAEQR